MLRVYPLTPVKDKGSAFNKSMLASKNLPKPITKPAEGHHWIRVLAAELALRLNDARQMSPNLWPKTLVLQAKKGASLTQRKEIVILLISWKAIRHLCKNKRHVNLQK